MVSKRKQLKQTEHEPDVVQDFTLKMTEWVTEKSGLLMMAFVGLVVLVGGITFLRLSNQQKAETQSAEYMAAMETYEKASLISMPEERNEQMADARTQFGDVADSVSGDLRTVALYMEAQTHYNGAVVPGDFDQTAANYQTAVEKFEAYIKEASSAKDKAVGHHAVGYAYESLAFLPGQERFAQDAIDAFKKAEEAVPGTWIAADSKLSRARVLSAMAGNDRKGEAVALLREIVAERERVEKPALVRDGTQMTEAERETLEFASSQLNTFGIVETAKIMLERMGEQVERDDS